MSNIITKAKIISDLYKRYLYLKDNSNLIICLSKDKNDNLYLLNKNSQLFLDKYNKYIDKHISLLKKQSRKYSIARYYEVVLVIKKLDIDCRPRKITSSNHFELFQDKIRSCYVDLSSDYGVSKLADALSELEWEFYRYQKEIVKKEINRIEKEISNILNQ